MYNREIIIMYDIFIIYTIDAFESSIHSCPACWKFLVCGVALRNPFIFALFIDDIHIAYMLIGHIKRLPHSCQILW